MEVQKTNPVSFNSKTPKKRYITKNMRISLESLLLRMNHHTERVISGDYYKSTIITRLIHPDGAVFEDERRLTKKVEYKEQMQGFSSIKLSKKVSLDIDNETGEIIDYKKPFYKLWYNVYKKSEKVLSDMRALFGLDEIKKETITINEPTPEGAKKIKLFVLQIEQKRLEDVTNKLKKELGNESK